MADTRGLDEIDLPGGDHPVKLFLRWGKLVYTPLDRALPELPHLARMVRLAMVDDVANFFQAYTTQFAPGLEETFAAQGGDLPVRDVVAAAA